MAEAITCPICPTCGLRGELATIYRGYCSPACHPDVIAEYQARLAASRVTSKPSPSGQHGIRQSRLKRRTRSERFAVLNAFVDFGIADAGLTPAEALVWLVLYRDTKGDGLARTAQADIARRAGLSVRGVKLALRTLKAKGMVQVVRRGQLNVGPSIYRVHPTRHMG